MKTPESFKPWPLSIPFMFSSVMMGLCVYKLIAGVPDNERALYWGGVTSVLAYWLPSPIRLIEYETTSIKPEETQSQELMSGLQIVQRPVNTTLEMGPQNTSVPLRYQAGDKQSW